ncbi:MAG: hypothetical protein J3K34DRAFT_134978 [Monoraphidium minutum]|nr:MAG: hypothetical protein J3K34DRAFT_134978 [Monoraphidium minutum]
MECVAAPWGVAPRVQSGGAPRPGGGRLAGGRARTQRSEGRKAREKKGRPKRQRCTKHAFGRKTEAWRWASCVGSTSAKGAARGAGGARRARVGALLGARESHRGRRRPLVHPCLLPGCRKAVPRASDSRTSAATKLWCIGARRTLCKKTGALAKMRSRPPGGRRGRATRGCGGMRSHARPSTVCSA